jgi:hypothetical protein
LNDRTNFLNLKKIISNSKEYFKVFQSVLKKLDANYKFFVALWKNENKNYRHSKLQSRDYFMTGLYNQSGFHMFRGYITFSHNVDDTELIFDLCKNYYNIKQI